MSNKVYVIEDMAISRAALIQTLEDANYNVVGSAANAEIAWVEIQRLDVDIALIDINLAGIKDGVWLGEKIRGNLNMAIVFLTAYGDNTTLKKVTAINPNGFLMKPYNKPTLLTTIKIALKAFERELHSQSTDDLFVFVVLKNIKVKIILKDIIFIQSDGNYIEIHLQNKFYVTRDKLKNFIKNLPKNQIIRQIHLRFAVNVSEIKSYDGIFIEIADFKIPVSKTYKDFLTF